MAYSSIEHMGVVALGFGFGGPLGVAGALYHMLNHSLNKSLMFFGAGNMMRAYGTKEIAMITRRRRLFSDAGRAVARRRDRDHRRAAVRPVPERVHDHARRAEAVLLLGGLCHGGAADRHLHRLHESLPRRCITGRRPTMRAATAALSAWCAVPMWLSLAPLLVLGLWWPAGDLGLSDLDRAVAVAGRAMSGRRDCVTIEPENLPDAVDRADQGRRPNADGLWLVSRARPARTALRREPRRRGRISSPGDASRTARSRASPRSARCWAGTSARSPTCSALEFVGHPEPYRLVLHQGARPVAAAARSGLSGTTR